MESCTCINCTNPHFLYASFKKNVKKSTGKVLSDSLTEFLTQNFECPKNNEFDYFEMDCIQGECNNGCRVELSGTFEDNKSHKYAQYVPTAVTFFNVQGKKVEYQRCARNEFQATLDEMQNLLKSQSVKYLTHRHFVSRDKTFWAQFMKTCEVPVLHVDYSENIKLTPKNEVQSAHFSGRQHTLHCSVLYEKGNQQGHKFLYHLS